MSDPFTNRRSASHIAAVAAAFLILLACWSLGCHGPSTAWRPTTEELAEEKAVLSHSESREVRRILGGLAQGHEIPPDRQPRPVDWHDIRRVVDAACSEVFMAVAQVTTIDDRARRYRIRTIDEKPAVLTVTRIGNGLIDFRAEATVGVFENEHNRAAELVEQFEQQLIMLRDDRYAAIGRVP